MYMNICMYIIYKYVYMYVCKYKYIYICMRKKIYIDIPRKSKDQTLPSGSRESFTWIILETILCLVLDIQGIRNISIVYVKW